MTMRAAILEAIGRPLVVEEVELRDPGPHEVWSASRPLVGRRFGLDEVNEALAAALQREVITAVVLPGRPAV